MSSHNVLCHNKTGIISRLLDLAGEGGGCFMSNNYI